MKGLLVQPARLKDAAPVDSRLVRGLVAAQARRPAEEEARAIERRLFAALGATAAVGAAAAVVAKASSLPTVGVTVSAHAVAPALSLKLGVALAVTVLAAGGGTLAWRSTRPATVRPVPSDVDAKRRGARFEPRPPALAFVPHPEPVLPQAEPRALLPGSASPLANRSAGSAASGASRSGAWRSLRAAPLAMASGRHVTSSPVAAGDAPTSREDPETLRSELRLIDAARAVAKTDPGGAVRLCLQHERRFPRGVMREEREAILIGAWASLGRLDEARARQASFDRAYPGSPYGAGLRARLSL